MGKVSVPVRPHVSEEEVRTAYLSATSGQIFTTGRGYYIKPEQNNSTDGQLINLISGKVVHYTWLSEYAYEFKPISHNEIMW